MPHRLMRSLPGRPDGRSLRVLTVFADADHRAQVHQACTTLAPDSQVLDAASATDAVLTLLSNPIDLVLVDVTWSGDLLGALVRHTRRSAPDAMLMAFGNTPPNAEAPLPSALGVLRPWRDLPASVTDWLRRHAVPAGSATD